MDTWSIPTLMFQFIVDHADIRIVQKGKKDWQRVTNAKAYGAGMYFRVEGEEWDVAMHDLQNIKLTLKG